MTIDVWHGVLKKQADEDKTRQEALNERHDKIIRELEAADPDWWLNYPTARSIMATRIAFQRAGSGLDNSECRRLHNVETNLKRNTIASYIIPAMYACIRAGFVKPAE